EVHCVVFRKRGATGPIRCRGLETDGEVAAVQLADDDTVAAAFAAGATFLRYNGQELFTSAQPENWATPLSR
ncbi:MAG: hypothetical protein HQ582_03015, partial [Planctomycetes bacterium]|nr:hypothetical protein [Planctomycetota bacterium]